MCVVALRLVMSLSFDVSISTSCVISLNSVLPLEAFHLPDHADFVSVSLTDFLAAGHRKVSSLAYECHL